MGAGNYQVISDLTKRTLPVFMVRWEDDWEVSTEDVVNCVARKLKSRFPELEDIDVVKHTCNYNEIYYLRNDWFMFGYTYSYDGDSLVFFMDYLDLDEPYYEYLDLSGAEDTILLDRNILLEADILMELYGNALKNILVSVFNKVRKPVGAWLSEVVK